MMDEESLRAQLLLIAEMTEGSKASSGYWVGSSAQERRVHDNYRAGRLDLKAAHDSASRGLQALERGDIDYARLSLREAKRLCQIALLKTATQKDFEQLKADAGLRGRPQKNEEFTMKLDRDVKDFEATGMTYKEARHAALKSDEMREEFGHLKDDTIRKLLGPFREHKKK